MKDIRWAKVPEFGSKDIPSGWVEVVILVRTRSWAMCRRKDSPLAIPFVRAMKDLRDKKPKDLSSQKGA